MSKPKPPDGVLPHRSPESQVKIFADLYHGKIDPTAYAHIQNRARKLGLRFTEDELLVMAALDTPVKVQHFMDTQIYYNDDHISVEQEETALPPRLVLQTGIAHCFEGALFAYTVNYLHGHEPRFFLLESIQDTEHNVVVWQDPQTKRYGSNAHSAFPGLDGRAAHFATIDDLARSYYRFYYSVRSNSFGDIVLVGYSEPFDLTERFGVSWMDSTEPPWDIYYTYIDASVPFHYLNDNPGDAPHLYALVNALKEKWLEPNEQNQGVVQVHNLPESAQELWHAFWREHSDPSKRPTAIAARIEKEFFRLTGTTPIDLFDHADDLQWFLAAGYRIEQLLKK